MRTVARLRLQATLLVGLFLLAFGVRSLSPQASEFSDALWIAHSQGLHKLDVESTPATLSSRYGSSDASLSVATDGKSGIVWNYRNGALERYDFDGTALGTTTIPTPPLSIPSSLIAGLVESAQCKLLPGTTLMGTLTSMPPHLAVDEGSGEAWLGLAGSLYRVGFDGVIKETIATAGVVTGVAVDVRRKTIWVSTCNQIKRLALSANGSYTTTTLAVGDADHWARDLAVDEAAGGAWIALGDFMTRVTGDATLQSSPVVLKASLLAPVPTGGVWAAYEKDLVRLSPDGAPMFTVTPLPGLISAQSVVSLSSNLRNGDAWVAGRLDIAQVSLDGQVTARKSLTDLSAGVLATVNSIALYADHTPPDIVFESPANGVAVADSKPIVKVTYHDIGIGVDDSTLQFQLSGSPLAMSCATTDFSATCRPTSAIADGLVTLRATVRDSKGNLSAPASVMLEIDTVPPAAPVSDSISTSPVVDGMTLVVGAPGSVEPGTTVEITNSRTGQIYTVVAGSDGSFRLSVPVQSGDQLQIRARDKAGNLGSNTNRTVTAIPANPTPSALSGTGLTPFLDSVAFLFQGPNAVQAGVPSGTLTPTSAAVLKGRVLSSTGTALSGVKVTVLGKPQFGFTVTRSDGLYDLVVNGGQTLTLNFTKTGLIPSQRTISPRWRDYESVPDVAMLAIPATKAIAFGAASAGGFIEQTTADDGSGARKAVAIFQPGTTAQLVMPDGNRTTVSQLDLFGAEFTAGTYGRALMPGSLPATSAYTYAIELNAAQAISTGAASVEFDKPMAFYVTNFLNFPVGSTVPAGYYDRAKGAWVASSNGRVVKLLSITAGIANLDVTGSGAAATASEYLALGITTVERTQLASRYAAGETLWRTPMTHFTPWDCNWPRTTPPDATSPSGGRPSGGTSDNGGEGPKSDKKCGSIIECQTQTLRESIPLTGSGLSLNYRSDRVPGRTATNTLVIPLSGSSVPASLRRIDLEIVVAGRRIATSYGPAANQSYTYVWDGKDIYGRPTIGEQTARVTVGYIYGALYSAPASFGSASFARFGWSAISGNRQREEITIANVTNHRLSSYSARSQGFGGWTLSAQHVFDPISGKVYSGDGDMLFGREPFSTLALSAGGGTTAAANDVMANQAKMDGVGAVVAASDGTYYFAKHDRIFKKRLDGRLELFAGKISGTGNTRLTASLGTINDMALGPDGSLYYTSSNYLRRIRPDDVVEVVAGTGVRGNTGDEGAANQAQVGILDGIAVAPDGTVYFADSYYDVVRAVTPGGVIHHVAGATSGGSNADGIQAALADLTNLSDLALLPDGSLLLAQHTRVRRVASDGMISTVAGKSTTCSQFNFDSAVGQPATLACLVSIHQLATTASGSFLFATNGPFKSTRLRAVGADGVLKAIAFADGGTQFSPAGLGGPANAVKVQSGTPLSGLAVDPNGRIIVASYYDQLIYEVTGVLDDLVLDTVKIASPDGSEVYEFDSAGRHRKTFDAFTGQIVRSFSYSPAGLVIRITDGDGNAVVIDRDGSGKPLAITAPDGQRTALTLDTNGYLKTVTNPASQSYTLTHDAGGLLRSFQNPRGDVSTLDYDAMGYLISDTNPEGGSWTLARSTITGGFEVSLTSKEGRVTRNRYERLSNEDEKLSTVRPDGLTESRVYSAAGLITSTAADGTVSTLQQSGDPRFKMEAPLASTQTTVLPSGLTRTESTVREVTLANASDPLSLQSFTERNQVNGREYVTSFSASGGRTFTTTTPAGRRKTVTLDGQGRPLTEQVTGLAPVTYDYDSRGRLESLTVGTGDSQRVTQYGYGADGYLATLVDAENRSSGFHYDLAGRMDSQQLPGSRNLSFGYDPIGNLTGLTPPGRPAHGFGYNKVRQATSYSPPSAGSGTWSSGYTFDLDQALKTVQRPDGVTVSFNYDNAGRPYQVVLPPGSVNAGTTQYGYNASTGQLASVTAPGGSGLAWTYDGMLPKTEVTSGAVSGSVGWTYDNDFRVSGQTVNGSSIAYGYDADSLLTQAGDLVLERHADHGLIRTATLGSVVSTYYYTPFGEVDVEAHTVNSTNQYVVGYKRDRLGRITQRLETIQGILTTWDYGYDATGRLETVKKDGAVVESYGYDANGNRVSANGVTGTYDNQDRLTSRGTTTYTYTRNGELLTQTQSGQTRSYQYDAFGNLLKATLPGKTIDYLVDGRNRRIGKKVGGALMQGFLYNGQLDPVAELDGSNQVVSRFIYGSRPHVPDYLVKGGATYRVISDHLGSVRLVVNTSSNAIVQRIDYDAWGNITQDSNPGFQPFGYAGGIYDRDTKLTRFGARDYDAEAGRWTAKDPIGFNGGDSNVYAYVENDPLNYFDSSGFARTSVDTAIEQAVRRGDVGELQTLLEVANPQQASVINRALTPARDLIRGQTRRSKSYASELEENSYAELCQLAKGRGELANKAGKMKKLIEQQERLLDKLGGR